MCFRDQRNEILRRTKIANTKNLIINNMPRVLLDESHKQKKYEKAFEALMECKEELALMQYNKRKGIKVLPRDEVELKTRTKVALKAERRALKLYSEAMGNRRVLEQTFEICEDDTPDVQMTQVFADIADNLGDIPLRNLDKEDDHVQDVRDALLDMVQSAKEGSELLSEFHNEDFQDQEGELQESWDDLLKECDTMFADQELEENEKADREAIEVKESLPSIKKTKEKTDDDSDSDSDDNNQGEMPILTEDVKKDELLLEAT